MSHRSRPRPTSRVAVAAGVVALAWAGSAVPAAAAPADVPAAVDYVVSQLIDGDHVETEDGFVQYGQTVDVALGLAATGEAPESLEAVTAYATSPEAVAEYTQGASYDMPGAAYAGATGKLGFAAALLGLDPTDVGGVDLVAQLLSLETESGRFSDRSDFGDYSNVLHQSFDVLFLTAAEGVEPSAEAVQFLVDAQCDDGGFPVDFAAATCESSPDATGLVIQALNADDPDEGQSSLPPEHEAVLVAAVRWLESARDANGAWIAFDAPNVNATAYGAMGLLGVGQTAASSIDWMLSLQLPDGGLPTSPGDVESNLYATAQALPPLVSTAFLTLDESVVAPMTTVPELPSTPTPTPTETTPTATPTGPTPSTTAPTTPPVSTSAPTPAPTLPMTGGTGTTVPLIGLSLLLAGAGIVLGARRMLTRP